MITIAEVLCLSLFIATGADESPRYYGDDNFETCVQIANEAFAQGVDPEIAISTGWVESRFNDGLISSTGCCHGPLQINPIYFCPNRTVNGCDLVKNGVGALERYYHLYSELPYCTELYDKDNYNEWLEPLCHYNSGNRCTDMSRMYARTVVNIADNTDFVYHSIDENLLQVCD
jgi:hypothetical protein